jgi:Tol biopolymer transport system component
MANRTIQIAEFDAGASLAQAPAVAIETGRTANFAPVFSPDGRSIAYLHDAGGKDNLRIYDLASGEIRTIATPFTPLSRFNSGPRWFPDGKSLLLLSPPKTAGPLFHRVDIATGKAELLHEAVNLSMSSYQLSPDGKSIYYCLQIGGKNLPGRILRYDLGAAAPVVLKDNGWFITLALSPDGSQLAYLESDAKGTGSHIAVIPAAGGESRRLVRDEKWMEGARYNALTWTRDGRHILYVRTAMANGAPNVVWRVPAAGGAPALTGLSIPSRLRNPSFHPDGRRLLFSTQDIDSGEIWSLENFLPRPTR